ncbi:MAG: hypothetical protein F9K29_10555 [Hyphomicrobiaceae bacterium]|nr:MAG: hypothetical protein F9K29_10555 [Hyphomicrobiaceae bacterium]
MAGPVVMDLLTAEQLNGKLWNYAKSGAVLCFVVASALLVASLFLPPPTQVGSDAASPPASAAEIR